MRLIHGLEVDIAPLSDKPALLCYTPNWEERSGNSVLTFEGDHVGAIEFDLEAWAWCPVDAEWWPFDREGETFDPTFGRASENLERRARFVNPEDAVMFLAAWWNQHNPSQSVRLDSAQVAA